MNGGTRLPRAKSVIRLAPHKPKFFEPAPARRLLPSIFEPTNEDKREAERRGLSGPQVSVWDTDLTTPAQAKAFRPSPDACAVLCLSVGLIEDIGREFDRQLAVVSDPLPADRRTRPGWEGHCGIGGLARPAGTARPVTKQLWARLVRASEDLGDV